MLNQAYEFQPKKIEFEPFEDLLHGADIVARAVGSTMGPHGRTVMSEVINSIYPKATKDGVSVARQIVLKDQIENIGAQQLLQAADKQVRETGDGTTLTVVLAHELLKLGIERIKSGVSAREVVEQIQSDIVYVCSQIKNRSIKCDTVHLLMSVATISANGDRELGGLIAKAIIHVGEFGAVESIKNTKRINELEFQDGYRFEQGIKHIEFCTGDKGLELNNPKILVTDNIIQWGRDLIPIVNRIQEKYPNGGGPPLLIICPEVKGEALGAILTGIQEKKMFIPVINPEGIAEARQHCLEDIAALTGAKFVSIASGKRLKDVHFQDLGTCEEIKSDDKRTSIRVASKELATQRVNYLQGLLPGITNEEDRDLIKKSIAKLTGGIATIKIGGSNESEQNEIADRIEDAILASRAAKEMGIVNGGGVELLLISDDMPKDSIVKEAIKRPIRQIIQNWDMDTKMVEQRGFNHGYDCNGWSEKNMIDRGVIDPAKVIYTAMYNAGSVARLMLNCSSAIILNKE